MENVYRFLLSLFASKAQAVSDSNLVSCGGLDCNVCGALETVSRAINWLFLISAAAAIASVILGGSLYIIANGVETKMRQAKKWILRAVIGFALVLVGWLVIHSLFHVFGATYKNSWWKVECEVEPPPLSVFLPIRRPVHLLEATKNGGDLSAVLAKGTKKEELVDLLKNLPDGKTISFKLDRGPNAETVIILKKENGKLKIVASNEQLKEEQNKEGSSLKQLFSKLAQITPGKAQAALVDDYDLDNLTDGASLENLFSSTSDYDFFTSFLELIVKFIESNENIIAIINETQEQLQTVNFCIGSGGSWHRFNNSCELENQNCPVSGGSSPVSCDATDKNFTNGCKCPENTCLENNECVSIEPDISYQQTRCQETGGAWGSFPVFQINSGRCSMFDPVFPYAYSPEEPSLPTPAAGTNFNGALPGMSGNPDSFNSGYSDNFTGHIAAQPDYIAQKGCICPFNSCLTEDGGCVPWTSPYPYWRRRPHVGQARKACIDSGGTWIGSIRRRFKENCESRGGSISEEGGMSHCYYPNNGYSESFNPDTPTINDDIEEQGSNASYQSDGTLINYPIFDGYCKCPQGSNKIYQYSNGFYYVKCEPGVTIERSVRDHAKKLCMESQGEWLQTKCEGTKCLNDPGSCKCPADTLGHKHYYDYQGKYYYFSVCHNKSELENNCTNSGGQWKKINPYARLIDDRNKVCGGSQFTGLWIDDSRYDGVFTIGGTGTPNYMIGNSFYCSCPNGQCVNDESAACQADSSATDTQDKCKQSGGSWQRISSNSYCDGTAVGISCVTPYGGAGDLHYSCPFGCKCPAGTCLDNVSSKCLPSLTDKQKCESSGGAWEGRENSCPPPFNSEFCYPNVYNCPSPRFFRAPSTIYGCNCPDDKCLNKNTCTAKGIDVNSTTQ